MAKKMQELESREGVKITSRGRKLIRVAYITPKSLLPQMWNLKVTTSKCQINLNGGTVYKITGLLSAEKSKSLKTGEAENLRSQIKGDYTSHNGGSRNGKEEKLEKTLVG